MTQEKFEKRMSVLKGKSVAIKREIKNSAKRIPFQLPYTAKR